MKLYCVKYDLACGDKPHQPVKGECDDEKNVVAPDAEQAFALVKVAALTHEADAGNLAVTGVIVRELIELADVDLIGLDIPDRTKLIETLTAVAERARHAGNASLDPRFLRSELDEVARVTGELAASLTPTAVDTPGV